MRIHDDAHLHMMAYLLSSSQIVMVSIQIRVAVWHWAESWCLRFPSRAGCEMGVVLEIRRGVKLKSRWIAPTAYV